MLHLAIVNPVDAKEKKKEKEEGGTGANYGGRTLWAPPSVEGSIIPTSGSQSSKWGELGSLAVGLVSKFSEDGVGRSTGNFDKKIAKKEKRGKKAGAARAERREAKWDYRQNKKAKKISAKTEGTYQPEKKESKGAREDSKRTGTASELKENQLRRANAAIEETRQTKGNNKSTEILAYERKGTGTGNEGFGGTSGFKRGLGVGLSSSFQKNPKNIKSAKMMNPKYLPKLGRVGSNNSDASSEKKKIVPNNTQKQQVTEKDKKNNTKILTGDNEYYNNASFFQGFPEKKPNSFVSTSKSNAFGEVTNLSDPKDRGAYYRNGEYGLEGDINNNISPLEQIKIDKKNMRDLKEFQKNKKYKL